MLWNLAGYHYDQLGHYEDDAGRPASFLDPRDPLNSGKAESAAERFRKSLEDGGREIDNRNAQTRQLIRMTYTRLHPTQILNSISV